MIITGSQMWARERAGASGEFMVMAARADEGRRGRGRKKKLRACVPQVKNRGNTESNLSQHPDIVPVDKLISLNINGE